MNLLIVDDQVKVVNGLLKYVKWENYGVDQVFGALSVREAQQILRNQSIDILLSDIEMPAEDGLSLVSWLKDQGMTIVCIMLTAHANFSYAQESVRLNIFEYILQPAAYESIASVVAKAVQDVLNRREQQHMASLGHEFVRQEPGLVNSVASAWLIGQGNRDDIKSLAALGRMPDLDQSVQLALLQILRWSRLHDCSPALLAASFQNIISEILKPYVQSVLTVPMPNGDFAVLIWRANYIDDPDEVEKQFNYLLSICHQYFHCSAALYYGDFVPCGIAETRWKELESLRNDNVERRSKVFRLQPAAQAVTAYPTTPHVSRWDQLLKSDHPLLVAREVDEYLDRISSEGKMNARFLSDFYQAFLKIFHVALGTDDQFLSEILKDPLKSDIYRNGMASVDQMKQFVILAAEHLDSKVHRLDEDVISRINQYIDEHLADDIHREDLARHMYLNPDYLNRVVKQNVGFSLKEYVIDRKMQFARNLLLTTQLPVSVIASRTGYNYLSHFSSTYKKVHNETPMKTRNIGNRGTKKGDTRKR